MPRWLSIVVTLLYPPAIYFGSNYLPAPVLAILLLPLLLLRGGGGIAVGRWLIPGVLLLVVAAIAFNAVLPLKFYPLLMNVVFLVVFASSLRYPPPIIERIARLRDPNLAPAGVTQVWCGFFIVNGALALITTLWATDKVWFWYNGVIVYGLMALLFGGEWLVRQRVMRHG
jgi:uncharacterized membrane protein